jgi:hypothetical protein
METVPLSECPCLSCELGRQMVPDLLVLLQQNLLAERRWEGQKDAGRIHVDRAKILSCAESLPALLLALPTAALLTLLLHDLHAQVSWQGLKELLEDLGVFALIGGLLTSLGPARANSLSDDLLPELLGKSSEILRIDAELRNVHLLASDRGDDTRLLLLCRLLFCLLGLSLGLLLGLRMRLDPFHSLRFCAGAGLGRPSSRLFSSARCLSLGTFPFKPLTLFPLCLLLSGPLLGFLTFALLPLLFLALLALLLLLPPLLLPSPGLLLTLDGSRSKLSNDGHGQKPRLVAVVVAEDHLRLLLPALGGGLGTECHGLVRLEVDFATGIPTRVAARLSHIHRDAKLTNLSGRALRAQLEAEGRSAPRRERNALHEVVDKREGIIDRRNKRSRKSQSDQRMTAAR